MTHELFYKDSLIALVELTQGFQASRVVHDLVPPVNPKFLIGHDKQVDVHWAVMLWMEDTAHPHMLIQHMTNPHGTSYFICTRILDKLHKVMYVLESVEEVLFTFDPSATTFSTRPKTHHEVTRHNIDLVMNYISATASSYPDFTHVELEYDEGDWMHIIYSNHEDVEYDAVRFYTEDAKFDRSSCKFPYVDIGDAVSHWKANEILDF